MAITRLADPNNGIRAGYSPVTAITTDRNVDFRDAGAILSSTTNANITLTLTDDATGNWPSNARFVVSCEQAGYQVQVVPASGVTLDDPSGTSTIQTSEPIQLIKTGTNIWKAYGGTGGFTGRAVIGGGQSNITSYFSSMEYVNIATIGNSVNFGTLTVARTGVGACASATRGIFAGGTTGTASSVIDYITVANTGNAISFGSLTLERSESTSFSNSTTGFFASGRSTNIIDYVTIASTGNAANFGTLTTGRFSAAGCSSPTRGIVAGGYTTTPIYSIEYVTMSTVGNALSFGSLTVARYGLVGASNNTRGVFMGGSNTTTFLTTIDYITIASIGNAISFGNLITGRARGNTGGNASNSVRGLTMGAGEVYTVLNIEYVTIATVGNALNFGNLPVARGYSAACSNAHGGL